MNVAPRIPIRCFVILAGLLSAFSAQASEVRVWSGQADANLLTPENWIGSTAPVATNALQFGAAGAAGTEITNASTLNFGYIGSTPAIQFTASASAYTFSGAGSIGIATGAISNASGKIQTFNSPIRFNTGNTYNLTNPNSGLAFAGTIELNADTTSFSIGTASGQTLQFGDLILGQVNPGNAKNLNLNGSSAASSVVMTGISNPGLTGNMRLGSNVKVTLNSSTGLSAATSITFNGGNASLVNQSGAPLSSPASLVFNSASQNYTFGAPGIASNQNISFTGASPFTADHTRTLTLQGTNVTVSSASIWNNATTGSRILSLNNGPGSSGNTFGIGGLSIGAAGESTNVTLTVNGLGNLTVAGGITNGQGTGTRSMQFNNNSVVTIGGASDYNGTTGVGSSATVVVNGVHSGGSTYTIAGTLGGSGTIDFGSQTASINFTGTALNTRRLAVSSVDGLAIAGSNATLNLTNAVGRTDSLKSFYFTLGAPGGILVDVQGTLNLGGGTLNFDDFEFTPSAGFGPGVYRLFDYVTVSGSLGTLLTGTLNGLEATISQDEVDGSIKLTVVDPIPTDSVPPMISLIGTASVQTPWGTAYADAGATASDDVDPSVSVSVDNAVNVNVPGTYTVTYSAIDAAGNSASPVTRSVTVFIANPNAPDAEGLAPLMRYAFGANHPTEAVQRPVVSGTATTLSITAVIRINDASLAVSCESTTDLAVPSNWTTLGVTSTVAPDQSNVPPHCERRIYSVDVTGTQRKFLRLLASTP